MVNDPAVLYADEPTANLDSSSGLTVMQTLTDLNREMGVTVLYVTHDPTESSFASRLVHLQDGRLVEEPGDGVSTGAVSAVAHGDDFADDGVDDGVDDTVAGGDR